MNTKMILEVAAVVCCCAVSTSLADVAAKVELTNGNVVEGKLRWMPASKKYALTRTVGGAAVEQQVTPSEIVRKQVAPPAGWRELVQQAAKSPDAALPKLLQTIDEYKMLEYDEQAAYYAGSIYLSKGKPQDVIKICEAVTLDNPSAASVSPMAPVFWEALIATDKTAGGKLEKMLTEAVVSAPRPVAAKALIARGDMLKKAGRTQDALKDGYLRCIFLYAQEKNAQAEALYKASVAFDELRQATYADRMRQNLLSLHKDSQFARKVRGN